MANKLSQEKRKQLFHLLVEGNPMRACQRMMGISINTITKFRGDTAKRIIEFKNTSIKDLVAYKIEADEIRTYVGNRAKHKEIGGTQWVYIGMDYASRFVIDFHVGRRDTYDARLFLRKLSSKLSTESSISTDCLQSYVSAINNTPETFIWGTRDLIELARARCITNLPRSITNRIESLNGNVRQGVSSLARQTRCFSKNVNGLEEHLELFFFYYNFIRKHKSIKTVPAKYIGLINEPLIIEDIL